MIPSEAFAGPSTELDLDFIYHAYQAQKAHHEEQRPERPSGSSQVMTDVPGINPMGLATASVHEVPATYINQGAINAEERSDIGAATASGQSNPDLRSSRKITVQQILEMYKTSAPLSELPADKVAVS